jgi:hypothetical protein
MAIAPRGKEDIVLQSLRSTPKIRRAAVMLGSLAAIACTAATALALPPFTTTPKSSPGSGGQAELYRITVACHPAYDRFVLRFRLATPGYRVRYVNQVIQDGSGLPVTLLGNKRLLVVLQGARAHSADGTTSFVPSVLTPRCPNIRQVKLAGDFEGVVSFGLGLKQKTGFRVFRVTGPTRVVVDVLH